MFCRSNVTWLLMDERRCDISMVEASDCRGGVAVSMCSLEAVATKTELMWIQSLHKLHWWLHLTTGPRHTAMFSLYNLTLCMYMRLFVVYVRVSVLTSACVIRDVWWGLAGTSWWGWGCAAMVKPLQRLFEAGCVQLWLWARVLALKLDRQIEN